MQPEQELEQIAPELIGSGAQAVVENAKRLGLTWTITLATVTSANPVEAIVDGDTAAIGMTSMIGNVFIGQRVYVIQVPPSGNFIAGAIGSGTKAAYTSYQEITDSAGVSQINFTDIPAGMKRVSVYWSAKYTSGGAVSLRCRVNNDSVGAYLTELVGMNNGVATYEALVSSAFYCGVIPGFQAFPASSKDIGSGVMHFTNWSNTLGGGRALSWNGAGHSWVQTVNVYVRSGGGHLYDVSPPYTSLNFFSDSGTVLAQGSNFYVEGYA